MVKRKLGLLEDEARNEQGVDSPQACKDSRKSRQGLRADKNLNLCTTCTACGVHYDWTGVVDPHGSQTGNRPDATNREMDALVSGLSCFGKAAIERIIENHLPHRTKQEIQVWIADLQASEDDTADQGDHVSSKSKGKERLRGTSEDRVSRSQSSRNVKDSSRSPSVSRGSKRSRTDSASPKLRTRNSSTQDGHQDERNVPKRKRESSQPLVEHHINLRSKSQNKNKVQTTKKKGKKKHSDDIELLDGASALLGLSSDTAKNGKKSSSTSTTPRTSGMSTRLSMVENSKSNPKEKDNGVKKANLAKASAASTRSSRTKESEQLLESVSVSKDPKMKAKAKSKGKSQVLADSSSGMKGDSDDSLKKPASGAKSVAEAEEKEKETKELNPKTAGSEQEQGNTGGAGEVEDLPVGEAGTGEMNTPWKASEVLMGSRIPEESAPRLSAAVVLMMNSSSSSKDASSNVLAKGKNSREDEMNSIENSPAPSSAGQSGNEGSYLKTLEASPAVGVPASEKAIEAITANQASMGYSEIIRKSLPVDSNSDGATKDRPRKRRQQNREKHYKNSSDEAAATEMRTSKDNLHSTSTEPRPTALSVLIGSKYPEPSENVGSLSEKSDVPMNPADLVQRDGKSESGMLSQQEEDRNVNEMMSANLSSDDQMNAGQEAVNAPGKAEGQQDFTDASTNSLRFEASDNHKNEGRSFLAPTAAQKWHQIHGSEGQRSAVQRYVQEKIKQGKIEKRPDGSLLLKEKNADATCKFWSEINDELFKATLGSRVKVHAITQALRRYCGIATPPGNTRKTEYVDLLVPTDMGEREQALRKARESHAKYQNNQDSTWLDRRRQPRNEKGRSSAEVLLANCSVGATSDAVASGVSDQVQFFSAHDSSKRIDTKLRGRGRRPASDASTDELDSSEAPRPENAKAVIIGMNWSQALTGGLEGNGNMKSQGRVSYGDALLNQNTSTTSGGEHLKSRLDSELECPNAETSGSGIEQEQKSKDAVEGANSASAVHVNNSDGTSEDAATVDCSQNALDETQKDGDACEVMTTEGKHAKAKGGRSKANHSDQCAGSEADKNSRSSEVRTAKSYAALVVEFGSAAAAIGKGAHSYASQLAGSTATSSPEVDGRRMEHLVQAAAATEDALQAVQKPVDEATPPQQSNTKVVHTE